MSETKLMVLDASWTSIEAALVLVAESGSKRPSADDVARLRGLGLVDPDAEPPAMTTLGERLWMAKFVHQDDHAVQAALADILRGHPVVTAFCSALWGAGKRPVAGALRLIRQLTRSSNDVANRRWLALMNSAGLIVYNQKNPTLRVLYNPNELAPAEEAEERQKTAGYVLAPDKKYSNLLALRHVLRSAQDFIWWYEPHMPAKVLEVLVGEIDGAKVNDVRILSGQANINQALKNDFGLFAKEMKATRNIGVAWRVLDKAETFKRHDRIILTKGLAKNVPPLNSILAGSVGEFLPSAIVPSDFEDWWKLGTDVAAFAVVAA